MNGHNTLIPPSVLSVHALSVSHALMRRCIRNNFYKMRGCNKDLAFLIPKRNKRNKRAATEKLRLEPTEFESSIGCLPNELLVEILWNLDQRSINNVEQTCNHLRNVVIADAVNNTNSNSKLYRVAKQFELIIAASGFVHRGHCHRYALDAAMLRQKHAVVRIFHNKFFKCSIVGSQCTALEHAAAQTKPDYILEANEAEWDFSIRVQTTETQLTLLPQMNKRVHPLDESTDDEEDDDGDDGDGISNKIVGSMIPIHGSAMGTIHINSDGSVQVFSPNFSSVHTLTLL
jgi:hypothetical protein